MGHLGKHRPSWFGLDEAAVQSLAESVCYPESGLPEGKDDTLCQHCQALPLDRLWCGSRFPSEEFENSLRQYSSLGKLIFYNFLYYRTKIVNIP
jgi:hypothetical protein